VTRCVSSGCRVMRCSSPGDVSKTSLTGGSDRSDCCRLSAARVVCSTAFSSRFWWLFVARISSTSVATWSW
jgi:hypothetical protein